MTEPVTLVREGPVAIITLNLPEKRNPLTGSATIDALETALRTVDTDTGVHCAILTGAGRAFSTGGDLRDMQPGGSLLGDTPDETRRNYRANIQRLPAVFDAIGVPVIAAVNGAAAGAGCDLACMCDIRIAGRSARFAESFIKLGLIPGDGGAWFLPAVVGYSKACEMALTGDWVDADEALAIGLVSRVVDDAALMDEARGLAGRIAANAPQATRITKRLLRDARHATLSASLESAASAQALMHETPEHRAAVQAFLDKSGTAR